MDADRWVLTLPTGLKTIEAEAFAGVHASKIIIPEGCESIGPRAFADCEGLLVVVIPATVKSIDETAFEGSPNAVIQRP